MEKGRLGKKKKKVADLIYERKCIKCRVRGCNQRGGNEGKFR